GARGVKRAGERGPRRTRRRRPAAASGLNSPLLAFWSGSARHLHFAVFAAPDPAERAFVGYLGAPGDRSRFLPVHPGTAQRPTLSDLGDHVPGGEVIELPVELDSPLEHLERYTVLRLIGAGGMGKIYQAYDSLLERNVVLKVMHPDV